MTAPRWRRDVETQGAGCATSIRARNGRGARRKTGRLCGTGQGLVAAPGAPPPERSSGCRTARDERSGGPSGRARVAPTERTQRVLEQCGYPPAHTRRPTVEYEAREARHKLSEDKRTYATRFADKMAICVANGLRERFPGVLPDESGRGVESPAQSVRGPKKLDVNYSTPQLGLGFGVSLKAVHFREKEKRGYIHNMKRNDEELRSEAAGYHQRQPYAVMIAVRVRLGAGCGVR